VNARTPGPWYTCNSSNQGLVASEIDGKTIAVTYQGAEDAAFIVEACNAHDSLVTTEKELRAIIQGVTDSRARMQTQRNALASALREALWHLSGGLEGRTRKRTDELLPTIRAALALVKDGQ